MFQKQVFTDSKFPTIELHYAEGKLSFMERGKLVCEMKTGLSTKDMEIFALGIFEGLKYSENEMRTMIFRKSSSDKNGQSQ